MQVQKCMGFTDKKNYTRYQACILEDSIAWMNIKFSERVRKYMPFQKLVQQQFITISFQ